MPMHIMVGVFVSFTLGWNIADAIRGSFVSRLLSVLLNAASVVFLIAFILG